MGHPFDNGYEKWLTQPLYRFQDGLHIISTALEVTGGGDKVFSAAK